MQAAVDALREMAGLLALVAVVLSLVALIVALRGRGARASEAAVPLVPDPVIDQLLASQMQRLDRIGDEVMAQAGRLRLIEGGARHMVQRVGIVRFNPFEETGGNQSFVVALLDGDSNGVLLTSLHARAGTRVYLRTVVGGRCDVPLSAEESEALRQAGVDVTA
ncbi:MAG: DUF4446 family protein [Candidatus Limnocylindrales bacterium]